MIVANGKGRVSTLAVDDDLDMNGRAVTGALSMSVTDHVTLVGAQRFPGKGFRSNERNGWGVSKDNGDIERKFWKDDFSVDSSSQYTGDVADFTWDTSNSRITTTSIQKPIYHTVAANDRRFMINCNASEVFSKEGYWYLNVIFNYNSDEYKIRGFYNGTTTSTILRCAWYINGVHQFSISNTKYLAAGEFTNPHTYGYELKDGVLYLICDGVVVASESISLDESLLEAVSMDISAFNTMGGTFYCNELSSSPSISYADDFATDTTERYQAVTGTVAYDDANKRMNVTTATGANGKASGRLKSYKFCEGSQIYDVLLPTGADGDFICLATHSANGLMTDGIGVGLQSDGAGNWNLATLSRTTITEGADSGLDDADVARIEIEKDLSGAYWYYIYDAAGAKPTTATGKLFTTLTEGYTGWYANGAGATTQTYAIENISIRAESIVGRTNVEEEEAFWFRDEFGEDSTGRTLTNSGTWAYDATNDAIVCTTMTNGNNTKFIGNEKFSDARYEIEFNIPTNCTISSAESDWGYFGFMFGAVKSSVAGTQNGYVVTGYVDSATGLITSDLGYIDAPGVLWKIQTNFARIEAGYTKGSNVNVVIEVSGLVVTATITNNGNSATGTYTLTSLIRESGYPALYVRTGSSSTSAGEIRYTLIDISGTRVYNKPIHRGAMLESYHDGTQEVVGTTFIDDCQWDRSAEYTSVGTPVWDTTNGVIKCDGISETVFTKHSYLDGYYACRFTTLAANERIALVFATDTNNTLTDSGTKYLLYYSSSSNDLRLFRLNAGTPTSLQTYATALPAGTYDITILKVGSSLEVTLNGIKIMSVTDSAPLSISGQAGFGVSGAITTGINLSNIQIIAASPDASNGIAACIPPIGGGARYGVEEEVYHTYTNEVRKGKYLVSTCVKTTNADAEAIEMYLENTTDSTAITEDDSKTVAIALTDTNYMDVEKEMKLGYADRGDTLKVAVRKTDAATEVSPACFVEMLNVTPTVEVI